MKLVIYHLRRGPSDGDYRSDEHDWVRGHYKEFSKPDSPGVEGIGLELEQTWKRGIEFGGHVGPKRQQYRIVDVKESDDATHVYADYLPVATG